MAVNSRFLLVRNKTTGVDALVDEILSEESTPTKAMYQKVLEVFKSPLRKRYMEACLLTGESFGAIADTLDMELDLVAMYHDLMYDVNSLDKLSKMDLLAEGEDHDAYILKLWATSQGLSFIAWRLGKNVTVSPVDGLNDLFTMCFYKAKEAVFTGNATDASRESSKWTKLSMDLARLLKSWVLDSDAAKKDIEIALAEIRKEPLPSIESLGLEIEAPIEVAPLQSLSSLD